MLDQGRTFLSKSSSRADAKEAAAKGPASKQREKGLWNFLTWSFFISHIVAAQQVAAASAMAAEASPTMRHTGMHRPATHPAQLGRRDSAFDRAEIEQVAAPQAQSIDPGAPTLVARADQAPMHVDVEAFDDAAAHGMPRGQTTLADLAEKSSTSDGGQPLVAPELNAILDQVLDPVADVVGGVVMLWTPFSIRWSRPSPASSVTLSKASIRSSNRCSPPWSASSAMLSRAWTRSSIRSSRRLRPCRQRDRIGRAAPRSDHHADGCHSRRGPAGAGSRYRSRDRHCRRRHRIAGRGH